MRAAAISWRSTPRTPAGSCPGTYNYYRRVGRRAALPAGRRAHRDRQPGAARQHQRGRWTTRRRCRSPRSISSAAPSSIRGWGRYEVSPLSRTRACRSAATACSPSARGCAPALQRQHRRRAVSRRRQRLGRARGPSTSATCAMRSARACAIRRRSGRSRFDVGYQLNPIAGLHRQRRDAEAPLAHSFQHRAGVSRDRSGACAAYTPSRFTSLIASSSHAGRRRDGGCRHRVADRLVQELAARLHRCRGEQVPERPAVDRAAGRQPVLRRRAREHRRSRWTAARWWRSRISASTTTCSR